MIYCLNNSEVSYKGDIPMKIIIDYFDLFSEVATAHFYAHKTEKVFPDQSKKCQSYF